MALRELEVRTAKAKERPYKLYDGEGLSLKITPSGGKLWRLRFVRQGKEKALSLGAYPKVSLSEARKLRAAALDQLEQGVDPAAEKRRKKLLSDEAQELTFKHVAKAWHNNRAHEWTPAYAVQIWNRLEEDIFPQIGGRPIAEIEPKEMLAVLKKVEARGVLETTRRLKQYCSAIFRFAVASGFCKHDPAAPLKGALKAPPKPKHHKALARHELGDFMLRLDDYDGEPETLIALQMVLLLVPRTTELRAAKWSEFEAWQDGFEKALWRIPGERMKMDDPHLVPLSRRACEALRRLHVITGKKDYLFPNNGVEGFMSNNTMLYALYRRGYHGRTTTHGFRSVFSTEANEHGWNEDWVERQLAHDERDKVRAAYNAAQYLPQRREMLQWWADYLDQLRDQECAKRVPEQAPRSGQVAEDVGDL